MTSETKSIFLYGNPTKVKLEMLSEIQRQYSSKINEFINIMVSDKKYYLDLMNNNNKSPLVRGLEKSNRGDLGSAMGQNAIDHAVKELFNLFTRIRNYLYGFTIDSEINMFISYKSLLNACIQNLSFEDTVLSIESLLLYKQNKYNEKIEKEKNEGKKKSEEPKEISLYKDILDNLNLIGKDKVEQYINEVNTLFNMELNSRKIPFVKRTPVQLDDRLFNVEDAKNIKADFVVKIKKMKNQKVKNQDIRICVPITTSSNSLRRINQYDKSNTATFDVTKKGQLKICIPFKKKIKSKSKKKQVRGLDVGITDLIHDSEDNSYGSFVPLIQFYDSKVLPEQAKMNTLRNLIKKYKAEIRKNSTPNNRKVALRKKIFNINSMLMKNKSMNRILKSYHHKQDVCISDAIKAYLNSVKNTNVTTVIEAINIKDFVRSKKENRRDSMWARAQLSNKLKSTLEWNGFSVVEVDPAYTSKMCSKCFYISDDNRKFKNFNCKCCGYESDADFNAAVNIKNRANDKGLNEIVDKYKYNKKKRHEEILKYFMSKHELTVSQI